MRARSGSAASELKTNTAKDKTNVVFINLPTFPSDFQTKCLPGPSYLGVFPDQHAFLALTSTKYPFPFLGRPSTYFPVVKFSTDLAEF